MISLTRLPHDLRPRRHSSPHDGSLGFSGLGCSGLGRSGLGGRLVLLGLLLIGSWLPLRTVSATVVYRRGETEPLVGYLLEQNEERIVLRRIRDDGTTERIQVPRAEIEDLLIPEDPQRLSRLTPDQPHAYREYAEELAEKRLDPEAIDLALRLFLIAAWHSDGELQQASLAGAIDLARNAAEARRLRAAAFQIVPENAVNWLRGTADRGTASSSPNDLSAPQRAEIANVLRLLRQGRGTQVRRRLEEPDLKQALDAYRSTITVETLQQWSQAEALDAEALAKLLTLEIALLDADLRAPTTSDSGPEQLQPWGATLLRDTAPVSEISLTEATEYDPRAALYREGSWIRE